MTYLPFDPSELVDNLRCERYVGDWQHDKPYSAFLKMYYVIRPILSGSIRRQLQKIYLSGWDKTPFPHWPVDTSVDNLLQQLFLSAIRSSGAEQIPFIAEMRLVENGDGWRIESGGSERARIAYASERDGHLVYTVAEQLAVGDLRRRPLSVTKE